ncbi:uncharacterized protein K452DRAFT_337638 [Aplosporella prunicola CBS 121167]|uniref:Uncharacterized protein n=1 Tax=Aplosporella prunicola CBS 121167 TaxID=1176127 RepID=A0A6A6B763_9PEZI|nr:uncharacterized protein K452DRAFT_337638 [Aplosporella prunicola CBS 121167]KAF2139458.1 hypothetical protein K452DRAFT_337638 [Aplosporella prunicola CBS 121167]
MSRNADVNRLDGFDLALRGAAILNDKEISHILLESPTGHCRSGVAFNRCIVEAFKRQHLELGWLLIDHAQGQDIEIALTQSLRRSSRNGWTETARSLLDRGANINGTGGVFSPPPLELAAFGGHEDTVQLLLERGASPEAGSGRLGAIVGVAYSGHAGAGRKLLDAGVQLPPSAWTLLLEKAARHESGDFIRLLVERGVVDLHALDDGDLANLVVYACAYGNIDLVKFYVKHGLPVAGPLFEEHCDAQPIAFAVAYGQRDMEKALLELGATPVDLSQSSFGEGFADGSYPCAPPKMEKPREYDILY